MTNRRDTIWSRFPTPLLLPVLIPQALWVASRAMRLPEAAGDRSGAGGSGQSLRVLVLGDSSAAGVGVDQQTDALAGRLASRLQDRYSVRWTLWAKSGITTSGALRMLAAHPARDFDVAVIALGVNDTKNAVHITKWQSNYSQLIQTLQNRFGVTRIFASGVPPLGSFPVLPDPLRSVLGARAHRFDIALSKICALSEGVEHMPFDVPAGPDMMAADGFHPSARMYDLWAGRIDDALRLAPLSRTLGSSHVSDYSDSP